MPIKITMPRLSDTMEEGTLIKWRVKVGDKVSSGDDLADVETDKATMDLQSFDDGTVAKLAVKEGQAVPVGGLILVLAEEGESVADAAGAAADARQAPATAQATDDAEFGRKPDSSEASAVAVAASPLSAGRIKVSPLARKLAQEHGVDLASLAGSGPDGRIIKRDILAAAAGGPAPGKTEASAPSAATTASAKPIPAPPIQAKTIALTNMRKTIAKRLVESKSTIPHFTTTVSVNMDPLLGPQGVKEQLQSQGVKLSVNDFVVRACVMALQRHPAVNSSWAGDSIKRHGTISIGVAVALPEEKGGGLVVPVLRDTQKMSMQTISTETKRLADKARQAGLTLEEMSDGTFTISNLGMFGVDHFEAIINPPQAAILAVGAALEKPVVRHGQIVVGREMTCTLSGDHRVIDGVSAAEFLQTLKQLLENPAAMLV